MTSSPAKSPSTLRSVSNSSRGYLVRASSDDRRGESIQSLRQSSGRPRTRTLEDRSKRDTSPTSLLQIGRQRVGSVHSAGSSGYGAIEDMVTSIGHPSTISQPTSAPISPVKPTNSGRNRLVKTAPREAPPLQSETPPPEPARRPVLAANARRILQLMRSSCGRMEGMLAFRRGENDPWSLAYCSINDEAGSLVYERKSEFSFRTLMPDLRGCRVKMSFDDEARMPFLDVRPHNSNMEVHLRPHSDDEFESWFAALLCWHPMRPKGIKNKMAKPQLTPLSDRRLTDNRRHSEVSLLKEAPIIKVGKMIFWDTNISYSNAGTPRSGRPQSTKIQSIGSRRWRRVSCTLRENGELKLYSDTDVTLVSVIQLCQLSRCAVQRLDPSVLDNDFCIAIYPQYSSKTTETSSPQPIFLSLESRVLYEVWLVLLRAFTVPQLYGPPKFFNTEDMNSSQGSRSSLPGTASEAFRMERSLSFRIIESKMLAPLSPRMDTFSNHDSFPMDQHGGYYAEIFLDGETRARTLTKTESTNPFWAEEFDFLDLPAALTVASVSLKKRPPSPPQNERSSRKHGTTRGWDPADWTNGVGGQTGVSLDETVGKFDIYLDELDTSKEVEKWWPLLDPYGRTVGDMLVRVRVEECVILMARDYQPMSELLHRFSNSLTNQVAQMIPGELKRLSECLLNIFQVSGQASEWIMALIEEEIDGTIKETPANRMRFSKRAGSNESHESKNSIVERELLLRDLGKSATLEANLLFRGNTLLTKAVDFHMKRLGKEYLEETLGDKIKEISEKDPDCEVDPNRIAPGQDMERNWQKLMRLTEQCWNCISASAARCPPELRLIFRHIRACAEDRYGDFLRTVQYSSVSGFLFLRFFCPAVLNPKLFGLLKDHPKPAGRRTLTLIAKSLQGLANLSTFGTKEHWMEPMNAFLSTHRQPFKDFIDGVCSIPTSSSTPLVTIQPGYSTPLAILQRLPPASREGFPSLPYLIDHARNFAALVDLWLECSKKAEVEHIDGDLLKFHQLCLALKQRTTDCLEHAERAERPEEHDETRWVELIEQLEAASINSHR
ncbi:Rho GTPase activation protein, partial [Aulographum hederae CBS 113979]